jgi:predicted RNA-binding protein YlxR (DUF448 family)
VPVKAPTKHERERRCVATGEVLAERLLIRFALAPDGALVPDIAARLPGRGAWVTASRQRLEEACSRGSFARALKAPVKMDTNLARQTETLLAKRCLDLIGMARKAGAIAFGATQVEAVIRAKPLFVLIEAKDGAEEGREKLMALHIGLWKRPPAAIGCFDAADLGMALGRDRVIHACLLQERLALVLAAEIGRLAGFRAIVPCSWPASWRPLGLEMGGADAEPIGSGDASRT